MARFFLHFPRSFIWAKLFFRPEVPFNSKPSQMKETRTERSRMAISSSSQLLAVFRVIMRWNNHQCFGKQSPKFSIFINFSLFDRSQLCSRDCVALVWFRVSHDSSDIKIAQLMEITQPMKQISQTLVHHLKVRNVKASICSQPVFKTNLVQVQDAPAAMAWLTVK